MEEDRKGRFDAVIFSELMFFEKTSAYVGEKVFTRIHCFVQPSGNFWNRETVDIIRLVRKENGTGADMRPATVSGIITDDAPVSAIGRFFPRPYIVTFPEVFAKVNSAQFPSRF